MNGRCRRPFPHGAEKPAKRRPAGCQCELAIVITPSRQNVLYFMAQADLLRVYYWRLFSFSGGNLCAVLCVVLLVQ